nr:hypothetical protein [Clostridia bacterium]
GGYLSEEESPVGESPAINPDPLCDIVGDRDLVVLGNTDEFAGYVVPPNDFVLHETQPYLSTSTDRFGNRHYHETNSLGIHAAATIADETALLYEAARKADDR